MPRKEAEKLLLELKEWADARYGRRAEVAQLLGVSKQLISEWFAGRSTPTWDHGLAIAAFLSRQRRRASSLFVFDVLSALPEGMDGPWGRVLVENKFRGDTQSMRNVAGLVALLAGEREWGRRLLRAFVDLVPLACTCDLSQMPEPDYEDQLGRAWVLSPELRALVRLSVD
jgi:DNA-binding XRE family transcriptional regulator